MNYVELDLRNAIDELCKHAREEYTIPAELFLDQNVKRGLRNSDGTGVVAGITRIGSVQGYYMEDGARVPTDGRLYYRGINMSEIVKSHRQKDTFGFEEVAYLLLFGKLPTKAQLAVFQEVLSQTSRLPGGFFEDVILRAPSSSVMNMLARSVLGLYAYDKNPDDTSLENVMRQSIELLARVPVIVANAYSVKRHNIDGKSMYIHNPKGGLSTAQNFLRVLRRDKCYTDEEAKLLDMMLMLHAEHGGGNNSAFACRVVSSTGADTYSAISAAIGSLKGPLHGGANKKVMEMFEGVKANVKDPWNDDQLRCYLQKILRGEAGDGSGVIYGLGHAVYTVSDPRAVIVKEYARTLAQKNGMLADLELMEGIERIGSELVMESRRRSLPVCANVDMYSGLVYQMLQIPQELFTPLFVIARLTGWCAHRIEELTTASRIIRPAYRAVERNLPYVPLEERGA